jgi:hypothetical protein
MGLDDLLYKLDKLSITGFLDVERGKKIGSDAESTFEAMFNPESISRSYEIKYGVNQAIGSSGKEQKYARSNPPDLSLTLILDGSGTTQMGIMQLSSPPTVSARIERFLKIAFTLNGNIHQPNFLVLKWGDITFPCRLSTLNIRYTSFDRGGKPLRAELDIKLISDESVDDLQKEERKSSPDLSHSRIVKAGDTLPLLAKEIYGSSTHYLWVAKANGLDEFRRLTPGQRLIFPPLEPTPGP